MLKSMSVGKVRVRHEPKHYRITIGMKGVKYSKAMRDIRQGMQQGSKSKRFGSNTGKDVKGMSGDDFRKARDYSNAVPGIRGVKEGSVIR